MGGPRNVANLDLRERIASNPVWYHTLELGPDAVTPGWFDLRPIVDRMPWPDVKGKRCLDVGTYDGFLAFELERRGAAEVVATDIQDHAHWDWPARTRALGPKHVSEIVKTRRGLGFDIAKEALGSSAQRVDRSVYDLTPERDGRFDVVVCGSLMLHLRDPVRALEAIRSVCDGVFMSAEQIDPKLTRLSRRRPTAWFRGGDRVQWWVPNAAGHRALLESAGFRVEGDAARYRIPFGVSHRAFGKRGVPHQAVCGRPDL
jgi:tRNA (mo5U34)-methyltransferase